jgi:hypothetical protein
MIIIFYNHHVYICVVHLRCRSLWKPHAYIFIYLRVLLVQDRVANVLRFMGSVSNLLLLTIADNYYSHDKMMERKMVTGQGYGMDIGRCNMLCPVTTGHSLVALFSLSVSIEDHLLLWRVVRSHIYYLEHILTYGSGKTRYSLVVGFGSFRTD